MTIIPAAGPLIVSSELLIKRGQHSPNNRVKTPASDGKFDANAIPMQRGNAIKKHQESREDILAKVFNESFRVSYGHFGCMMGLKWSCQFS